MAPMRLEGIVSNQKNGKIEKKIDLPHSCPLKCSWLHARGPRSTNPSIRLKEKQDAHTHKKKREWINIFREKRNSQTNDNKTNIIHNIILQTRIHE